MLLFCDGVIHMMDPADPTVEAVLERAGAFRPTARVLSY